MKTTIENTHDYRAERQSLAVMITHINMALESGQTGCAAKLAKKAAGAARTFLAE